jgi:hypothetical protein
MIAVSSGAGQFPDSMACTAYREGAVSALLFLEGREQAGGRLIPAAMEKIIEEKLIGNRWIVKGVYKLSVKTKSWIFFSEYRPGKTVWSFEEPGTLTVTTDDTADRKLPFRIVGAKLCIDPATDRPAPDWSDYKESYIVVPTGDGFRLYDTKTKIATREWFSLNLIPELFISE